MLAQTTYRSSHWRCSVKNVFLRISHYSQENTCVGVSLWQSCSSSAQQLYYRETPTPVFSVNIEKFFKTTFLKNICERLLLLIVIFWQENNHMQHCFDLPEPNLHNKLTFVMLFHSPQTTFHRKIIYNFVWIYLGRSSHPDVFCKKGVLRNIAKLTGKNLCQSLFFNKVAGLRKKKRQVFSVNFVKFLK